MCVKAKQKVERFRKQPLVIQIAPFAENGLYHSVVHAHGNRRLRLFACEHVVVLDRTIVFTITRASHVNKSDVFYQIVAKSVPLIKVSL